MTPHHYQIYLSHDTLLKVQAYKANLLSGKKTAGAYLKNMLNNAGKTVDSLPDAKFIELLLQTKKPQIFAESAVQGNGTDWNSTELSILGDIGFAVPVTIYDNGVHEGPNIRNHSPPFKGELLFTPAALLAGCGSDGEEILSADKQINDDAFYKLYERRLLPLLTHANEAAKNENRKAFITIPGLGCGAFAGDYKGQLEQQVQLALKRILSEHGSKLQSIQGFNFDPNSVSELDECVTINGIKFQTLAGHHGQYNAQLKKPEEYGEAYKDCKLFSIVAWDHVSWPGNDFYIGSRKTDDGVKAAATDVCFAMTAHQGLYNQDTHSYNPPAPYNNWGELIASNGLKLPVTEIKVVGLDGTTTTLSNETKESWVTKTADTPKSPERNLV